MSALKKSVTLRLALLLLSFGVFLPGICAADEITDGKAIYGQYCAVCHGRSGEGNGPIAGFLTIPPVNLRLLYQKYGNPLSVDQIEKFIDGRADVKTHGPRDMPVWGKRFYGESGGSEADTADRLAKLVAFLQSIQTGPQTGSR